MAKMDKIQYVCPKCGSTSYETDQFQATGGNFAKLFDIQNTNCGYTELYRGNNENGMNILDFLIGG